MAQTTAPYLTVKGAADAIAFYQKAFEAIENTRMQAQDGKRLMHASLSINGGIVMLADEFTDHGGPPGPTAERPSPVAVSIIYETPAEVDATYRRAVGLGGKSIMEPADMFWGDRFAMLTDPFGHRWMFTAPLNK